MDVATRETSGSLSRRARSKHQLAAPGLELGIEDVWDLIWFHFRTDDPRETNWYMHHYLGCWQSNDGKIFSFRDADPGIVYMPPLRYKSLATVVADALSAKVAHFPYVAYKHVLIDRMWLLVVIRHIRARRIKVRVAKLRENELAAYGGDMFILNESTPARGTNTSLSMVHEATHAILDLQKAAFPRWEHELMPTWPRHCARSRANSVTSRSISR